jgi:flagellar hook protein FlgE
VGGVKTFTTNNINQQGRTISSNNPLNVAINGKGLFLLNTQVDGSGETLYTRDGGFGIRVEGTDTVLLDDGVTTATIQPGYLVDKNGHFVQAWTPDGNGNFSTSSATSAVRLDNDAFDSEAEATTDASLAATLPVSDAGLATRQFTASVYDANGDQRSIRFILTKDPTTPQLWSIAVETGDAADTITSGGAPDRNDFIPQTPSTVNAANNPSNYPAAQLLQFDELGNLPDDSTFDFSIQFSDGQVSTVSVDLSNFRAVGQTMEYIDFQKDGRGPGKLQSFAFDESGQIIGRFTNGVERALYKLPLATFVNPDGLEVRQGNLFAESANSGSHTLRQVRDPAVVATGTVNNGAKSEFGTFIPFAHELGNTNLEMEFSNMILTQQAYNSSATVFKTVDEMTKTASELKS